MLAVLLEKIEGKKILVKLFNEPNKISKVPQFNRFYIIIYFF